MSVRREEHAAGLDPHQLHRLQVGHDNDGLPDEIFRFVILSDAGHDLPFSIDLHRQLDKLVGRSRYAAEKSFKSVYNLL